jgi:hypothetical protein
MDFVQTFFTLDLNVFSLLWRHSLAFVTCTTILQVKVRVMQQYADCQTVAINME